MRQSMIEFLELAVRASKNLNMAIVPLEVKDVQAILVLLRNPPPTVVDTGCELAIPASDITSLAPDEVSVRVAADRPGYVGIFKKAKLPLKRRSA